MTSKPELNTKAQTLDPKPDHGKLFQPRMACRPPDEPRAGGGLNFLKALGFRFGLGLKASKGLG